MPVLPVRPNADAVVASAEAGVKAIFCEKPFTNSLADADRMVEACSSRGVHIASGVMVSSHPDYQKAYELAASGEIGEVRRINLYENNAQGGCHGLNLARKFAAKTPVETVTGRVEGDPFSDCEEPYEEGDTGFGGVERSAPRPGDRPGAAGVAPPRQRRKPAAGGSQSGDVSAEDALVL